MSHQSLLLLAVVHGALAGGCWKHAKGRGAGEVLSACAPGLEKDGLLCYPTCPSGYYGVGPVCWGNCPPGWRDDGAFCAKPAPYGRGWGHWTQHGCEEDNGVGNCEENGWLWYPKCAEGYKAFGCCICTPRCPDGFTDVGVSCAKPTSTRGWGRAMICKDGLEQNGALCYHKCASGWTGAGPVCWQNCNGGLDDCGAFCSDDCPADITEQVKSVIETAVAIAASVIGDEVEVVDIVEGIIDITEAYAKGICPFPSPAPLPSPPPGCSRVAVGDEMYTASFQATGCPNTPPAGQIGWWKGSTMSNALYDMYAYCTLVRDRKASSAQKIMCCGSDTFCPVNCNLLTSLSTCFHGCADGSAPLKGDDVYRATFQNTGCPNRNTAVVGWWKTVDMHTVLNDMYNYCAATRDGKATAVQRTECCGTNTICPVDCVLQTSYSTCFPPSCPAASQLMSKDDVYVATFQNTGCPNPSPSIGWWKTVSEATALGDMYAYCTLVASKQAVSYQKIMCCGSDTFCAVTCKRQTRFSDCFPANHIALPSPKASTSPSRSHSRVLVSPRPASPSPSPRHGTGCWKHAKGRGAGVPMDSCTAGLERSGLLCYPPCKAGYTGLGSVCWQNCPAGFRDDGAFCDKPAPSLRSAYLNQTSCVKANPAGCEKCGMLWFGKCAAGYHAVGCVGCMADCPAGFTVTNTSLSCAKPSYVRGTGVPMVCNATQERSDAFCFSKCPAGWTGVGPVCFQNCATGQADCSAFCAPSCRFGTVNVTRIKEVLPNAIAATQPVAGRDVDVAMLVSMAITSEEFNQLPTGYCPLATAAAALPGRRVAVAEPDAHAAVTGVDDVSSGRIVVAIGVTIGVALAATVGLLVAFMRARGQAEATEAMELEDCL